MLSAADPCFTEGSNEIQVPWLQAESCRRMMNKHPPFKCLNIRIPIIVPFQGRGLMNQESGLVRRV